MACGKHPSGVATETNKPKGKARRRKSVPSQNSALTKELVVKLTPVPVCTGAVSSTSLSIPPSPERRRTESSIPVGELEKCGAEVEDKGVEIEVTIGEEEVEIYCDNDAEDDDNEDDNEEDRVDAKSLSLAEDNKRSPRVKTTPRRRRTTASPTAEHAGLAEDDSDSDEVPEVLLQTAAAMGNSEEEGTVGGGDGDEANQQVRKQRLFGLVKTTPPDRSSRKRSLKDRSSSSSSSSSASSRRGSQGQGSAARMTRGRARKVARMIEQGGSSSSEVGGQELESGRSSDSDDQRIKPLTEGVTLLGSGNFQQSSGEIFSYLYIFIIISKRIKSSPVLVLIEHAVTEALLIYVLALSR